MIWTVRETMILIGVLFALLVAFDVLIVVVDSSDRKVSKELTGRIARRIASDLNCGMGRLSIRAFLPLNSGMGCGSRFVSESRGFLLCRTRSIHTSARR